MSFVKVLSSLALCFTVQFASAQVVRQVHLEGRLEGRNNQTVLIFEENGQIFEAAINTPLEDFRGQEVAIDGQLQNDLLVVEWMTTKTNCMMRGKVGRGFYGIGSIEGGVHAPEFHPYLPEELSRKLGVYGVKLAFDQSVRSFNADAAEAVVAGVIQNGTLHVSSSYGGFVVRKYVKAIAPGNTILFSAILGRTNDPAGTYRVEEPQAMNIKHDVSQVSIPAGTANKLTATVSAPVLNDEISGERQIYVGQLQSNGHVVISEVWPENKTTRRMLVNPVVLGLWSGILESNVAIVNSASKRHPRISEKAPVCEDSVTAEPPSQPTRVPFLRVIK